MRRAALLIALAAAAAACRPGHAAPPSPDDPAIAPSAKITDLILLQRMLGVWRWLHSTVEDGTLRVERERWVLAELDEIAATGEQVIRGRYRRDVTVLALDTKPFLCNQQPAYVQSALFDVVVTVAGGEVTVLETAYATYESPCEPGFRHLGSYRADPGAFATTLAWDGGSQTLQRLDAVAFADEDLELGSPPTEPIARFAGAWQWSMVSRDDTNNIQHEREAWDLAIDADGGVGGTYQRDVEVHDAGGATMTCAGASSYRFVDRYTLRGTLEDDLLTLYEVAVDADLHPCLAATPDRHMDSATAIAIGDHLQLQWRGKRRQVLHRP